MISVMRHTSYLRHKQVQQHQRDKPADMRHSLCTSRQQSTAEAANQSDASSQSLIGNMRHGMFHNEYLTGRDTTSGQYAHLVTRQACVLHQMNGGYRPLRIHHKKCTCPTLALGQMRDIRLLHERERFRGMQLYSRHTAYKFRQEAARLSKAAVLATEHDGHCHVETSAWTIEKLSFQALSARRAWRTKDHLARPNRKPKYSDEGNCGTWNDHKSRHEEGLDLHAFARIKIT